MFEKLLTNFAIRYGQKFGAADPEAAEYSNKKHLSIDSVSSISHNSVAKMG